MIDGGARSSYEAMAPVYDDFTAHHDYDFWIAELLTYLEGYGLRRGSLLDVGCGTGKSFMPMLDRGWDVTACDISPAMLERAREKAGQSVQLTEADMRELPVFGEFDLVWALDDAVNYLLSPAELVRALTGMRRNLATAGLLVFDVNTLLAYRTFFAETSVIEHGGRRLTWRGRADAETEAGDICEAVLEASDGAIETHLHRERHFPEPVVCDALEAAGLECLSVYGLYTDGILKQPLDEAAHTKATYIACRR